jgi:PAS domain S-box-containing protein
LRTARFRLFLLVILVVLPALSVQVYGAWSDLQHNLAVLRAQGFRTADQAQGEFEALLAEADQELLRLAGVPQLGDPQKCTQVFTNLRFAYERLAPAVSNLGLATPGGEIYCAIQPMQAGRSQAAEADLQAAFTSTMLSLGDYGVDPIDDTPVVTAAYPAAAPDGTIRAIIFAIFDADWLASWQAKAALPDGTTLTLLAPTGRVLWRSADRQVLPVEALQAAGRGWAPNLLIENSDQASLDLDGVARMNVVVPLGLNQQTAGYFHLGYPVQALYTQAYNELYWKLGLLGLVLAAALLLAWWGSQRMFLRPLNNLMKAVAQVQAGDLGARAATVGGLGELEALAQSFDEMTGALERREADLRQSEARFRTMFETSAIGIGIMGLDRKVISANPALCQMYGYTCDELIGQTNKLVVHPDDFPQAALTLQDLIDGKFDQFSAERRYIRKNGEVFWGRLSMSIVRDGQGQPLYIVGMVADINDERLALAKLQESEARFRAMFENTAVGVALMTLDRRIVQVNPTAVRIVGYSAEEMGWMNPSDLAVEEDRYLDRELFQELVAGRRDQYQMEKRYIRKDGSIFWGRVNFALVRDMQRSPLYIVGIIEDITEEKRSAERLAAQAAEHRRLLEQRIAERTEELNQANERLREKAAQDAVTSERTRLARDLHDAVTQTLFSTTLIADVLPEIWEMNPAEGRRRLEEVRQLTRGALAEMRTLLVELRPNALVEAPLPALLRQLSEAIASRSQISIQLSAEEDGGGEGRQLPGEVQVSLYRIAQEALNNVVKHAHASQAVVTLRMGESVRLSVADDGAGFDPSAVTADHLGLKIMRERAEAINARLSVYSEPGEGTQISVVWRRSQD